MIKNSITKNIEKQINSICEFNRSASFSLTAQQDSNIKSIEKSLTLFSPLVIKMPAKPTLRPRKTNKQVSPFKLTNEEDNLRPTHIVKFISEESQKFQIKIKRDRGDFQFMPKMKQRKNFIFSYLKKKSNCLNHLKNERDEELNQRSQYAEELNNKKRCFSYAKASLVNFNHDFFLFGNNRNNKIDSSNQISNLYSFSSSREKKSQTSKNFDFLRTQIDYCVHSFNYREA